MEQLDVGDHACQVPPAQKKLLASVRIYMHRDKITGMKLACKTRLFFIQEKKMHKSSLYVTIIYFVAKPT